MKAWLSVEGLGVTYGIEGSTVGDIKWDTRSLDYMGYIAKNEKTGGDSQH